MLEVAVLGEGVLVDSSDESLSHVDEEALLMLCVFDEVVEGEDVILLTVALILREHLH